MNRSINHQTRTSFRITAESYKQLHIAISSYVATLNSFRDQHVLFSP